MRCGCFRISWNRWGVKLFPSNASSGSAVQGGDETLLAGCASFIMYGEDKGCTAGFQRQRAVTQTCPIQLWRLHVSWKDDASFSTCNLSNNLRQQVNEPRMDLWVPVYKEEQGRPALGETFGPGQGWDRAELQAWLQRGATPGRCW